MQPNRDQVTMSVPFMSAYSQLVIQTCHKRNVHAMGGMAAQIPIKGDEAANNAAIAKVKADKELEAKNGHDGTWVAHQAWYSWPWMCLTSTCQPLTKLTKNAWT